MADASSLIHPARVPMFWSLLRETFEEVYVPRAVYEEALKGRDIQSPEVLVIERAIEDGWIKVMEVKTQPKLPENLGKGEKEAIALMEQVEAEWLLMDDRVASITARLRGLRVRPVTYLPIYWKRRGMISQRQAIRLIDDLVETGYYLSPRNYVEIKELITST